MLTDHNPPPTGEEKKVVAALLGKLYISPASTESLIRELYAEVSAAVERNLIPEAVGRNALYKIHVSLGKIVNSLDQQQEAGRRRSTMSRSVSLAPSEQGGNTRAGTAAPEDRAAVGPSEPRIKEEDEEEEEGERESVVSKAGEGEGEDDDGGDSSNEGTVIQNTSKAEPQEGDSIVSELLDDDGDTVMS